MRSARTLDTLSARIDDRRDQTSWLLMRQEAPRPHQSTFTERYRGTEFETPVSIVVRQDEGVARGRLFVLMAAASSLAFCALIVANAST